MDTLPGDVLTDGILARLTLEEVAAAGQVCSEWRRAVKTSRRFADAGFKSHKAFVRRGRRALCVHCRDAKGRKRILLKIHLCEACKKLPPFRLVCKSTVVAMVSKARPGTKPGWAGALVDDLPHLTVTNPHGGENRMKLYILQDAQNLAQGTWRQPESRLRQLGLVR